MSDLHNVDIDTYNEYYSAISRNIQWLKNKLEITGNYNMRVYQILDRFGVNFIGDNPGIFKMVKDILLDNGIIVSLHNFRNEKKFNFSKIKIPLIAMPSFDDIEKLHNFLRTNKLYDDNNNKLICPNCYRYDVEFIKNIYSKTSSWWCNNCIEDIIYYGYNLKIEDKDKYHIYKLWGADALSVLTNENLKKTVKFIASYFKDCCVTKKDKCLYYDFFNKEKKNQEILNE